MSQLVKPIMFGVLLLKFIVVGSLLTAILMSVMSGEVSAQTVDHRKIEQQQTQTRPSMRQMLHKVELFKPRQGAMGSQTAPQIAHACRDNFSLGFAFVRAMYFASLSEADKETREKAILELVYLIDRVEHKPTEAAALQKVLQMVLRNTGTESERWQAVHRIIGLHNDALSGEEQWYFKSAVSVSKLFIVTYLNDGVGIRSELQNLQSLTRIAPQSVPRNVLASMQKLVGYFDRTTFTEDDRVTVISTVENIIATLA